MAAPGRYSTRDVARILGLGERRLLHWARTGVVTPSLQEGSRRFYTFADLVAAKAALELVQKGVSLQTVRRSVVALREALPEVVQPLARLRVRSDGDRIVVSGGEAPFEPLTRQLVIDFSVAAVASRAEEVASLAGLAVVPPGPVSPYEWFIEGCAREPDDEAAAVAYRHALALDPTLAPAHTNLGNLAYRAGRRGEAKERYLTALGIDPEQPEGRHNLALLLVELGEVDEAIAHFRRLLGAWPDLAEGHFQLAITLLEQRRGAAGARELARLHLGHYLLLEQEGEWADEARRLLGQMSDVVAATVRGL